MTVKELITQLSRFGLDEEVFIRTSDNEGYDIVSSVLVYDEKIRVDEQGDWNFESNLNEQDNSKYYKKGVMIGEIY